MTLANVLGAAGPRPGDEKAMRLYGRLVGTWDVANRYRGDDGSWVSGTAVWTFGWVLAGRAVQDVMWFSDPGPDGFPAVTTGSTMRLKQAGDNDDWRVVWFSPDGRTVTLVGRPGPGGDIVQEGVRLDRTHVRWLFNDVTETSFRWLGYMRRSADEPWDLEQEMLARRRP
ncbi:hypothetical protein [Actinoplanes sp. DH11]|uniref:hypothetical protein n=1 Tax=Actinoplanes sp. DH11 TaxID=2857011 RepID=UPI001E2FF6A3|nr:hypothetical protein [Actinoplanes sp. DH11]